MNTHVLRSRDFDRVWLTDLFARARWLKQISETRSGRRELMDTLRPYTMACFFAEESTRTRTSFEMAALRLGLRFTSTENGGASSSMAKGETFEDTIDALCASGPDIIVFRHPDDDADQRAASISERFWNGIPIINAGSGRLEHPTQSFTDTFTIEDSLGRLDNLVVGIGADILYSRTAKSLAYMLPHYEHNRIIFVCPPELAPPQELLTYLDEKSVGYELTEDITKTMKVVDVMYWGRLQTNRIADPALRAGLTRRYADFTIAAAHAAVMQKHALLMHPKPINKETMEISLAVQNDCPQYKAREQMRNALFIRMALYLKVLGK